MNYGIVVYVLGWVLTLEGALMSLPFICGLIYGEKTAFSFLIVGAITALLGVITIIKKPKNQQLYAKEGLAVVGLSWILISLVGAIPFTVTGQIPSYVDALFETISGFTTTGSSILNNVEALDQCMLFWRSFTHWFGGMGVIVFLLSILPMVGGFNMHLMRAESPGPSVGKFVPKMKDTAKILYSIYFVLTFICFVALVLAGMPVFDSIVTALGTAGTGGFGIKCDSMASYSSAIQWIVTVFMILFGVNFHAYFFLLGKDKKQAFKMEEVRAYFAIIIISALVITWNICGGYEHISDALRDAFFSVGTVITTTGFGTADFNLWPTVSKTILVMLMFMGACAGSTGGGIKVSRYIIIFKTALHEIFSYVHPKSVRAIRLEGKPLDKTIVRQVMCFIGVYVIIFNVSLLIISFDGFDVVTNFTAVTATLNNIGPGLNMVGPTGNFAEFSILSKFVLMFDMLAGRLELFPMLVLFVPSLWRKK